MANPNPSFNVNQGVMLGTNAQRVAISASALARFPAGTIYFETDTLASFIVTLAHAWAALGSGGSSTLVGPATIATSSGSLTISGFNQTLITSAPGQAGTVGVVAGSGAVASGATPGTAGGSGQAKGGTGGAAGAGSGAGGTGGIEFIAGGSGGAGSATGLAGAGGALSILGGAAGANGGAGGANGGNVTVDGGIPTGAGTGGTVTIGASSSTTAVSIGRAGMLTTLGDILLSANLRATSTDISAAPGSGTINALSGRAAFPATSAAAITITNSFVLATSHVLATVSSPDATCFAVQCTAGVGSFSARPNATTTGITKFDFLVVNV